MRRIIPTSRLYNSLKNKEIEKKKKIIKNMFGPWIIWGQENENIKNCKINLKLINYFYLLYLIYFNLLF